MYLFLINQLQYWISPVSMSQGAQSCCQHTAFFLNFKINMEAGEGRCDETLSGKWFKSKSVEDRLGCLSFYAPTLPGINGQREILEEFRWLYLYTHASFGEDWKDSKLRRVTSCTFSSSRGADDTHLPGLKRCVLTFWWHDSDGMLKINLHSLKLNVIIHVYLITWAHCSAFHIYFLICLFFWMLSNIQHKTIWFILFFSMLVPKKN